MRPIEPTGDRMVWTVQSERNPLVRYRVDATANLGAMWCSCADFRTRRQPAIDRGEPTHTAATMCKHCRQIRDYFFKQLCEDMAKSECVR